MAKEENAKAGVNAGMDMQKRLQERYMEFQTLEQQLKQMQENLQNVDMQLVEIRGMQQSLREMENVKEGSEILVPVASGMFVKGSITDSKTLLVNVGSNIVVDKTVPEAVDLLEKQLMEVSQIRQQFGNEMNRLASKMQAIEEELQKLVSEG